MHKTFWLFTLGVAAGLVLNNTISGIINPVLTSVKLSVAVTG